MSARLTEQELAEIMEYVGYWKYDSETRHGPRSFSRSGGVIRLQKLLAELDAVRAERDEARREIRRIYRIFGFVDLYDDFIARWDREDAAIVARDAADWATAGEPTRPRVNYDNEGGTGTIDPSDR